MCGIIALMLANSKDHCRQELFDALTVLQHRGQDAAGIVTANTEAKSIKFQMHKGLGMVNTVFQPENMANLQGNVGIGHCRYPTAGSSSSQEAQPMYLSYPCGLAMAHNGNLTNSAEESQILLKNLRHLNTDSDSEVLLNVFAEELCLQLSKRKHSSGSNRDDGDMEGSCTSVSVTSASGGGGSLGSFITQGDIFGAVKQTMKRCKGGYAAVVLIHDVGVISFRDPWGIRPLVFGQRNSSTQEGGIDYVMASESVAVDTLGFQLCRDVRPGECVLTLPMIPGRPRANKGLITQQLMGDGSLRHARPCLFEYVYFARPDSIMNGVSVYQSRLVMGVKLAENIMRTYEDSYKNIDVVIPIPDTSRTSALQCAKRLGKPYREGFIKNRYIGRTFIMPGQAARKKSVRLKLNTIKAEFKDKNVLLVDDSIVRGTTSMELVEMAREAGAKEVYFVSAAPPVVYPNVYGIDLPCAHELIAHNKTSAEVAATINADWVLYQTLPDLESSVTDLEPELVKFESSTFNGEYCTGELDMEYWSNLSGARNDAQKQIREKNGV